MKYIHPGNEHDGNLDEFGNAQAWLADGNVYVRETETIELFPRQALSLLDWLREHEEELRELDKESEG